MINHGKTKNIRWVLISASLYLHWVQGLQGHNSIASVHSPYECLTVLHFKRLGLDLKASSTRPWCRWCQRWERRRAGRPSGATLSGRRRRLPVRGSILILCDKLKRNKHSHTYICDFYLPQRYVCIWIGSGQRREGGWGARAGSQCRRESRQARPADLLLLKYFRVASTPTLETPATEATSLATAAQPVPATRQFTCG